MNRKKKIYHYVVEETQEYSEQDVELGKGLTTTMVSDSLTIQRSNVSKDLNVLVREGLLHKTSGRPVRYYASVLKPHKPLTKHVPSYKERKGPGNSRVNAGVLSVVDKKDVFRSMIGANGSMRNVVDQAKAAVLYPPKGLNTLVTGPTGSGKSFFAHAMFHFAQANQLISDEKELVLFNCADYANNPQLLMSHLFGYTQGAFTGATASKEGLIQQAHNSMLFLDEIHRLPPEGQEMVFYFMDTGLYSRLGETGKSREANVRIVCATTEDPKSTFLDTFMRRIPINIQLPSFKERPVNEQLDLVKLLTSLEASRIQKEITLSEDVIKALIASVGYGNVGQLKSSIQLVCARGFMNQLNQDNIFLTVKDLPETIQSHLVGLSTNGSHRIALSQVAEAQITVKPNEPFYRMEIDAYELPYNLYDIIGDKATLLEAEGLDQDSINQYISTDINVHLKSFYRNHGFSLQTESKLGEVVSKEVIQFVHEIAPEIEKALETSFKHNFIYAISLHISSLLSKINVGQIRQLNNRIREMAVTYTKEFEIAESVTKKIAEQFSVVVPQSEVYYLTVLLVSLKEEQITGRIGVVIATHGNSTASSMARVVEELLDTSGIKAVDMPLDMSPTVVYDRVKQAISDANEGSGVLLLVDMGSLATFEGKLRKETGIHVRSIDMVSTAMLLEATRKASLVDADIEMLYESLARFNGYGSMLQDSPAEIVEEEVHKLPIMVAICASGEGTAQKLKEIIEKPLVRQKSNPLKVLTTSIADLNENIQIWQKKYTIVATTGVIDPKLTAPFIPLEYFIEEDVEVLLDRINLLTIPTPEKAIAHGQQAKELIGSFLEKQYMFLNPKKVLGPLWEFVEKCSALQPYPEKGYAFHINLALHMAGVIERLIHHDTLSEENENEFIDNNEWKMNVKKAIESFEKALAITIPESEYSYIEYFIRKKQGNIEDIDTLLEE